MHTSRFLGLTAAALSFFFFTSSAFAAPTDKLICKLTSISTKLNAQGGLEIDKRLGAEITFNNIHCKDETKSLDCCKTFHASLQLTPFPIGSGMYVSPFASTKGYAWLIVSGFNIPVTNTSCTSTSATPSTAPSNMCYQTPAIKYVETGSAIVP